MDGAEGAFLITMGSASFLGCLTLAWNLLAVSAIMAVCMCEKKNRHKVTIIHGTHTQAHENVDGIIKFHACKQGFQCCQR